MLFRSVGCSTLQWHTGERSTLHHLTPSLRPQIAATRRRNAEGTYQGSGKRLNRLKNAFMADFVRNAFLNHPCSLNHSLPCDACHLCSRLLHKYRNFIFAAACGKYSSQAKSATGCGKIQPVDIVLRDAAALAVFCPVLPCEVPSVLFHFVQWKDCEASATNPVAGCFSFVNG